MSGSCCLSRPIKSEQEKELLVLLEEAILICAMALYVAWSQASLALTVCLLSWLAELEGPLCSKYREYIHK